MKIGLVLDESPWGYVNNVEKRLMSGFGQNKHSCCPDAIWVCLLWIV